MRAGCRTLAASEVTRSHFLVRGVRRFVFRFGSRFGVQGSGFAVLAAVSLAACSGGPDTASPASEPAAVHEIVTDIHSFARPAEARVTHLALDLRAAMAARQLQGTATLTVQRRPGATELVLDTRDLDIEKVTDGGGGALKYTLGEADAVKGRPLTIALPERDGPIVVSYRTRPTAAALQWLTPEQTAGKRLPYLFSQGQAILTRTWIPDAGQSRHPPDLQRAHHRPVDAARRDERGAGRAEAAISGERRADLRVPDDASGAALSHRAGDRRHRRQGDRAAHRRFTPSRRCSTAPCTSSRTSRRMVEQAEPLLGPYRWGRYDLLVLPPSFPFGGMENPRLTFATPTIIAGDRSLVSLVAHELAHSWSGNLVTNATWSDFWLNEGFTTYVEFRIMEAVYGKDRADMLRVLGRQRSLQSGNRAARRTDVEGHRPPSRSDRQGSGRRGHRHRVREGRAAAADHRSGGRPRTLRRLSAVVFRSPRLPIDHERRCFSTISAAI